MGLVVIYNRLPEYLAITLDAIAEVVKDTTKTVANVAAGTAAVDTGSMQASIYYVTKDEDTYEASAGIAAGLNPKANIIPEVEVERDRFKGYVSCAVEHGLYIELGTRYMGAQPFLGPAGEGQIGAFVTALSEACNV